MLSTDYPQKLILTKIEEEDRRFRLGEQHTHYFKVCDEDGKVVDDNDWYQIESGTLSIEVSNLSFKTALNSVDPNDDGVGESNEYEGSYTNETLRGQGRLVRGSARDPIDGYDVCLSHFGNDNQHKEINVSFNVIEKETREFFQLVGIEAIVEPTLYLEESFNLSFYLHSKTFDSLRKTISDTDPDHIDVTLDLEFFPGLYTKYSWALGNDYGVIKQIYGTRRIINADNFEEGFLDQILCDTYSSRGHKFNIVVSKGFAGSISETSELNDDDYDDDELQYAPSQSEITNALVRDMLDAQEITNKRLLWCISIVAIIAGLLLGSLW